MALWVTLDRSRAPLGGGYHSGERTNGKAVVAGPGHVRAVASPLRRQPIGAGCRPGVTSGRIDTCGEAKPWATTTCRSKA